MSDEPARIKINGGLVGGPDQQDQFPDKRNDYQRSEVAMDFNAGFTGAAAGLASFTSDRKTRSCGNTGTGEVAGCQLPCLVFMMQHQLQAEGVEVQGGSTIAAAVAAIAKATARWFEGVIPAQYLSGLQLHLACAASSA
jgi:hypothetical protein